MVGAQLQWDSVVADADYALLCHTWAIGRGRSLPRAGLRKNSEPSRLRMPYAADHWAAKSSRNAAILFGASVDHGHRYQNISGSHAEFHFDSARLSEDFT